MMLPFDKFSGSGSGALVILSVMETLESALCSHADTTPTEHKNLLLASVAQRYASLLSLFRSPCPAICETTALLMRAIVEESTAEKALMMQLGALKEGALLKHFHQALFSQSEDERYISRYLVELWMRNNDECKLFLKRCLPEGFLVFLNAPPLVPSQLESLMKIERAQSGEGKEDNNDIDTTVR